MNVVVDVPDLIYHAKHLRLSAVVFLLKDLMIYMQASQRVYFPDLFLIFKTALIFLFLPKNPDIVLIYRSYEVNHSWRQLNWSS